MKKEIDFVIPCHPKDFPSLELCVNSIQENITICNNIYVISEEDPKFNNVIHISEKHFQIYVTRDKIQDLWFRKNPRLAYRAKWIYQQLLKLLSFKVIPDLSDSYVLVDADTLFLNDINFDPNKFYYCKAEEYHHPYLQPIKKLLSVDETIGFSCISHHMIFNKEKLKMMIKDIESKFNSHFVDIILDIIDYNESSCFSEWDLYANYMILNHSEVCELRQLKWDSIPFVPNKSELNTFKGEFDFVSCHAYIRGIE